ncbi:MAG TPA: carboxypeptidase regulatory-like domain-containing protein [Terriglobales bacterium]
MNLKSKLTRAWAVCPLLLTMLALLLFAGSVFAQETTGGLQGTIKDSSGAVVAKAHVVVTGTTLVGNKEQDTDASGYYRFANLPPGTYTITVTGKGFKTAKREGIPLEVGHLPTIDIPLEVGGAETVVEVSAAAPIIDVTTNTSQTNITADTLAEVPHGYTFQSVIQFAPMARNEPLAGSTGGVGNNATAAGSNGGALPGSSGNGSNVGYSIGGAADSESSYLVEGQDTESVSGGFSQANVPFQFIQEVQVKTSGIEAEHGGALGGVVNVVMRKGGNDFHGTAFFSWEGDPVDGSPNAYVKYNPLNNITSYPVDNNYQTYQPTRDHFRIVQPGFTVGGPIQKDKLWFFLGFAPQYTSRSRNVNFGPAACDTPAVGGCPNQALGIQNFVQDNQQYFGTARLDYTATSKIRLFASWLDQYTRTSGSRLPRADSINGYLNSTNAIFTPLTQFSHGLGFSAPNSTYNFGGDITITPHIVSTTRFGYYFNNYHDFGWPTAGNNLSFQYGSVGGLDNTGAALPATLQVPSGTTTTAYDQQFTEYNASKHYQFNQDVAFYHGGWWGTHNIKGGFQYNRLWNIINQHGNVPLVNTFIGPAASVSYSPTTTFGGAECAKLEAVWGACTGQYGYVTNADFSTVLKTTSGAAAPAVDNNYALFVQDAWTVGHGLTLNLGIRVEKESLPAPAGVGISGISTINFSWSDKIEPRLGAAWDVMRNGKLKLFGSYGVVNDVMKLLLAQTSFGAQRWNNCSYPLGPDASGTFAYSDITFAPLPYYNACPVAGPTGGGNFLNGVVPPALTDSASGVQLIENTNFRPEEPVAPNVKPYRQHEMVFGADYQLNKNWALEARYDRRRLDHVIEDSSLSAPTNFEYYAIVNPGQGVNQTLDGYASFLRGLGAGYGPGVPPFDPTNTFDPTGICAAAGSCPSMPLAVRNYDGIELRATMAPSHGLSGMFSYTWSSLWGNYTGLTTTDQSDGGTTGRNSPDTSRSFDEPLYYYKYTGQSANGPLPTDRPNTLKGNVYYQLPYSSKRMSTTLGLFQVGYQGSPVSSFVDIGYGACCSPIEATYAWGRGNWVNATSDPATGLITLGSVQSKRTPWYTQTDLQLSHSIKVNSNNENQVLTFNATSTNLFNQHAVVSYWQGLNSDWYNSALFQYGLFAPGGAAFYKQVMGGYNPQAQLNAQQTSCALGPNCPVIQNSQYGAPNQWQFSRNMRFGATFTW